MDVKERTAQLENAITMGHFAGVRRVLDDICNVEDIQEIEQDCAKREVYDPLISAIKYKEEDIALYLVEKGFNYRLLYNYPGCQCDEWCYYEHLEDKCPADFDAFDLSQEKGLTKVTLAINDIRLGRRMPGDGLALMQNPEIKREDSSLCNRRIRSPSATNASQYNTKAMAARRWVKELGTDYLSRNGDTIIHLCDSPAKVHVCANLGVNINTPNFAGNTALHQAVQNGQRDVCQALLMNGADPCQRNKLGQTAVGMDECCEPERIVCEKFKNGLLQTVMRGEYNTLERLARLWCNPVSKITRDGRSALELAKSKKKDSESHLKLYNILHPRSKTLELTHAVLSEDIQTVKKIITTEKGWSLNKRFKDKIGDTMVSCVIEQHNLEILQMLVEQEVTECNLNLRVMERNGDCATIPILFKTLEADCPEEIWSYVDYKVDCFQVGEKDSFGNTALLRAIQNGKSCKFLRRFIKRHKIECLTDRNRNGQTARELAMMMNRRDVVQLIDDYIQGASNSLFMSHFPVNFYGYNNLPHIPSLSEEKYKEIENNGVELHGAVIQGNLKRVTQCNDANYMDKNGYTALTRAVVCRQFKIAEELITERPVLKVIPDNCNRYPLHYAYALPGDQGEPFIRLLLQRNPEDIEFKMDMYGRTAAEYKDLHNSPEIREMLLDVLSLDPYSERITPVLPNSPEQSPDIEQSGRDS